MFRAAELLTSSAWTHSPSFWPPPPQSYPGQTTHAGKVPHLIQSVCGYSTDSHTSGCISHQTYMAYAYNQHIFKTNCIHCIWTTISKKSQIPRLKPQPLPMRLRNFPVYKQNNLNTFVTHLPGHLSITILTASSCVTLEGITYKRIVKTEELYHKHSLVPLGAYLRSLTWEEPRAFVISTSIQQSTLNPSQKENILCKYPTESLTFLGKILKNPSYLKQVLLSTFRGINLEGFYLPPHLPHHFLI